MLNRRVQVFVVIKFFLRKIIKTVKNMKFCLEIYINELNMNSCEESIALQMRYHIKFQCNSRFNKIMA